LVDQKEAYSADTFFEGADRHPVIKPLNPVRQAQRIGCTVWDGQHAGRYFLIVDDLDKDGKPHDFSWRMIVNPNHKATPREDGMTLLRDKCPGEAAYPALLDFAMLSPAGNPSLVETTEKRGKEDTAVKRLVTNVKTVNPHFTVCLYPRQNNQPGTSGMPGLVSRRVTAEGGHAAVLSWAECADRVVVFYGAPFRVEGISTDAKLAVIRTATQPRGPQAAYGPVVGFLMFGGTFLEVDGVPFVKTAGGPCSVAVEIPAGQVAVGMADKGTVTVTGFAVKQVSRYSGATGGESLRFRRTKGQAPGAEIHLSR
jgi:hypothetical protein